MFYAVIEYREVLSRRKFKFPPELVDVVVERLAASGLYVQGGESECTEVKDPDDRRFYAAAEEGRKAGDVLLVTGNLKHFPKERFVMTPADFVRLLGVSHK